MMAGPRPFGERRARPAFGRTFPSKAPARPAHSLDEAWLRRPGQAACNPVALDVWQQKAMEAPSPAWRLDLWRVRVTAAVTRGGDPGCCPSGGRYAAALVLCGDQLELRRIS